jgi:hypothetical protein
MYESFIIISGIIALLSIVREVEHCKIIFWIFIVALIIFDGLRWEMGVDWPSYYNYFYKTENFTFERGFVQYTSLFQKLTNNYSIYMLITTAIIYVGIFFTVFKITNYSFLSIFYLTGTLSWYSGSLRQMMACVFFTLALKATIDKKIFKFIVLMILGVSFHTSIIVFLPIYWLYGMSSVMMTNLFILLSVGSVYSSNLIYLFDDLMKFFGFNKNYSTYLGGLPEISNSVFGFLRKFLTVTSLIAFTFISSTNSNLTRTQREIIKFTLFLSCLSIIFYYIGTYHIAHVSSRLDIYAGIIGTSVLIGILDSNFTKTGNRLLLYAFVVALIIVFYYRLQNMDLFHPYTSVFYNYDFHRNLH